MSVYVTEYVVISKFVTVKKIKNNFISENNNAAMRLPLCSQKILSSFTRILAKQSASHEIPNTSIRPVFVAEKYEINPYDVL